MTLQRRASSFADKRGYFPGYPGRRCKASVFRGKVVFCGFGRTADEQTNSVGARALKKQITEVRKYL